MPKLHARIIGLERVLAAIFRVRQKATGSSLVPVVKPVGTLIKTDQKRRAPKRTGFLASRIEDTVTVTGPYSVEVDVGPRGVDYALFPEMGTVRQAAKPYARPSLDENEQRIIAIIRRNMADRFGGR